LDVSSLNLGGATSPAALFRADPNSYTLNISGQTKRTARTPVQASSTCPMADAMKRPDRAGRADGYGTLATSVISAQVWKT
jgi:hypothetical protein